MPGSLLNQHKSNRQQERGEAAHIQRKRGKALILQSLGIRDSNRRTCNPLVKINHPGNLPERFQQNSIKGARK
ncbi:unnamed protein product [Amaranthus hypochondriacus]